MISKRWFGLGLFACILLLSLAYFYFQQALGLVACPLCLFQRACLLIIGGICLLGLILPLNKTTAKTAAFFNAVFSALGVSIAGRQVWLQHLPADKVPECGPGLFFMLDRFPLMEVITSVFAGSGECAEVHWRFLGLSMAGWMIIVFAVMLVISIKLLFTRERKYFKGKLGR